MSVFWYGGKILQSNAAAKMCTNRVFGHPTHCILHTQYILHMAVKTCCWVLTAELTDSEGFAHFQIRICLGTKPVSCSLVFFILFSLWRFAFPKKWTWFRRLIAQFKLIAHRWRWRNLHKPCKYRCFICVFSCIAFSLQFRALQPNENTAILYWTYRAELTNDPGFRVNQKWMTVKPHASGRKRWKTTVRFATSYDSLCDR